MNQELANIYKHTSKEYEGFYNSGGFLSGLVDSFEGLPSYDDQKSYVLGWIPRAWNSSPKAISAMKANIDNMSDGELRSVYTYIHDYHDSQGGFNDKTISSSDRDDYTAVMNNYNIPVIY